MPAYCGPWRVVASQPPTPQQLALARKLVGGMLEVGGIPQRQWQLDDGSMIHVLIVNGMPKVTITQKSSGKVVSGELFNLWLPRGFLVYPSTVEAPKGVGLPIVPVPNTDAFAPVNLDPGLDMARWTAGGPHGQVLLSMDPQAGYPALPQMQSVPIAFSTRGPTTNLPATYDSRPIGHQWQAFRPAYSDFIQHYTTDDPGPRRALFEALNAHRQQFGLSQAYLWPRGFYRPAEVLAYLMQANGTDESRFPETYRTIAERSTKDGEWSELPGNFHEAVASGSTAEAMTTLQADPGGVLDVEGDFAGYPIFADVGRSGGRNTLVLEERSQWIAAGRRAFQSIDTSLPPISWDAPPALNLGYMTLPIVFDATQATQLRTSLLTPKGNFYAACYQSTYVQRPALGPHIYCRGRAIARLPVGGLVLGAAIRVMADVDRLIVVAHQQDDNAALDWMTEGYTRFTRVWYFDFPRTKALRLHADTLVTEWNDGGLYDVGGIKYESLWSFTADGSRAVCLRETATIAELIDSATGAQSLTDTLHYSVTAGISTLYSGAIKGAVVELVAASSGTFTLTTSTLASTSAAGYTEDYNTLPHHPRWLDDSPGTVITTHYPLTALAADYVDGAVRVAYAGIDYANIQNATGAPPDTGAIQVSWLRFYYLGVGGTSEVYTKDLPTPTLVGSSAVVPEIDSMLARTPQVMDLARGLFVCSGYDPHFTAAISTDTSGSSPALVVDYQPNAASQVCMLDTDSPVHRVRVWRDGGVLSDRAYPHPSPALWNAYDPNETLARTLQTVAAPPTVLQDMLVSQFVQPFSARRFGEEIIGYQVGINNNLAFYTDFSGQCAPTAFDLAPGAHVSVNPTIDDYKPVGGWFDATFEMPEMGATWLGEALVC